MKITVVYLSIALLAGACQTAYQPTGFTGGFDELQLSGDTYRISVRGNSFTSRERAEEITLLRASELTIQNGYERFVVVGGAGVAEQQRGTTDVQVSRIGNSLVATGGDPIIKPSGNIVIRMLSSKDAGYASALDARLIDSQLRPKLVRS